MAFDGVTLAAVRAELETLEGAKIQKIQETQDAREIVITVYTPPRTQRLVISCHPQRARFHRTRRKYQHPAKPSTFVMTLRKHLIGGVLQRIEQEALDRIARLVIHSFDDLGAQRIFHLVAETMGRFSNLLLVAADQEDRIVAASRYASAGKNSFRSVLPGHPYHLPPQDDARHPLEVSETYVRQTLLPDQPAWLWLVQRVSGPGPQLARRILRDAGIAPGKPLIDTNESIAALVETLHELGGRLEKQEWNPCLIYGEQPNDVGLLLPYPVDYDISGFGSQSGERTFSKVNAMLDAYYSLIDAYDDFALLHGHLWRDLNKTLERFRRRLAHQQEDLARTDKAADYQLFGELLTTFMHQVSHGIESVSLPNYYADNQPVEIPLNPTQSPSKNAAHYFREYRRMQRTQLQAQRQLKKTRQVINYVVSLLDQVQRAEHRRELEELQEEALMRGMLATPQSKSALKAPPKRSGPPQYRVETLSDGRDIYIGRNHRSNDYLTMQRAQPDDLWFHVKDMPGSHVILPGPWSGGHMPDEIILEEAAQWAAYHSAARQSANVPVDYTVVRHVSKPKGAQPGMVIYTKHRTLHVTPPRNP